MLKRNITAAWLAMLLLAAMGCRQVPQFPQRAMRVSTTADGGRVFSFDTNNDRQADYWQVTDPKGQKVELRFENPIDLAIETVRLSTINGTAPHFIIALDGVPYELVEQLYNEGCFRLFPRPSRMISTFPAMTDLAFQQIFGGATPVAYQATHYDPVKNRIISGNDIYLSGQAANWAKKLDYRCSFTLDAFAYTNPEMVFKHELRGMMDVFAETQTGTKIAYSVATAGLGTRGGREAILKYLRTIDQFCEQLVFERKGRVKITLLADHGQNMSGRDRVTFKQLLANAGYQLRDRIESPTDVVTIEYGLVTYAAYFTPDPAGVAHVILQDPVAELACYPQGDAVVVQTLNSRAFIREKQGRFKYEPEQGDPLELVEIIEKLGLQGAIDDQGYIDDRAMFFASATHAYPDPLRRVWRAFHGLVEKPADLIICIKDGWVHGSEFFHVIIGGATSTHGSLNRVNSATFVMSMLGQLPDPLRPEDIIPAIEFAQTHIANP